MPSLRKSLATGSPQTPGGSHDAQAPASPIFSDFAEIYCNEAEVRLTFVPTQTEIWFDRNQQTGALLETIHIWHRTVSEFGHFVEAEVVAMARKVAEGQAAPKDTF